jgi:endonuclease YncB( thermonuclease family)
MLRRPLILFAIVLALVLGFLLGFAAARANLDFSRVREVLRGLPVPKELPRFRPTPEKAARAAPKPPPESEAEKPAEAAEAAETEPPPDRERGRVIRVVDGDTLHVEFRGRDETVRLLRVNTPERGRPGYDESTEALRELIDTARIDLEFEKPTHAERDRYGRLLAYVFLGERNINIEMVRLGWSRFWTQYGEGRYAEEFRKAESEARAGSRGLRTFEEEKKPAATPRRRTAPAPVKAR